MQDILLLFLTGIFGGFLSGLLGIGGGIIYILVLPIVLEDMGVPRDHLVQFTVANSVFGTLMASISGNLTQIIHKNFFLKDVLLVGSAATIISLCTLNFIVYSSWYSMDVFNVTVILILIYMLVSVVKNSKRFKGAVPEERDVVKMGIAGASGGLIAALSGLGGGLVVIPLLNIFLKMDIKKAKSISLGVILISALFMTVSNLLAEGAASFSFFHIGYIAPSIVLPLGVGVMLAAPYGVLLSKKMTSYTISLLFSVFVILVVFKKLYELFN
ncbi:sulfite exporter TauE/SafE family protein [Xanthovirga aplysinae]|uniref:sulfite exporter TauE/SafE family protein n=1 Tax=Xanthovirga aplysinae TaxID=2529853 RepID=UPI0012BD3C3A|nr:sulfite exporter TauE/SafE family protein [Xanthovirga aplysinae]MTI31326.1 sulfite exporter TauE/SafE family protein [Xanthovirga aplysinae]